MPIARAVTAVVLGGGRGTRLYPLTRYRSKPAVPLAGKYRLIDVPISNCINSGLRRIFVLTQFNSASLNHHLGTTYRFDAFTDGFVSILAAEQTPDNDHWYQGTADAVRQNLGHITSRDSEHVLILSGDSLWRQDFRLLLERHVADNAEVSIVCKTVSAEDAPGLGIAQIQSNRRIVGFAEKPTTDALEPLAADPNAILSGGLVPDPSKPYLASMGIYLFRRDVLFEMLHGSEDEDFGRQVIPDAIRTRRVYAQLFDGYWEDIGTIRAFFQANLDLLSDKPPFQFYDPSNPVHTRPRLLPCSEVMNSTVNRVMLGEGSQVRGSNIQESMIGIRSIIRDGCDLNQVVMMGADYYDGDDRSVPAPAGSPPMGLGRGVVARRAIIDKNARVGDGCRITNEAGLVEFDSDHYSVRDGIVIVPKAAVLPPGTVI